MLQILILTVKSYIIEYERNLVCYPVCVKEMPLYFMSLPMLVIILSSMVTKIKIEFDGFSLSQNRVRA